MDWRGPENRFVEGMRDALAGWIAVSPTAAATYAANALKDDAETVPRILLSRLGRLVDYLTTLDARARELLMAVVPYVHTDYSMDHMVEELARLADGNPSVAAEILERMIDAHPPNYDLDDHLKGLIRTLASKGLRTEALRCAEKLRKSLPDIRDLYKELVAGVQPN